MVCTWWSLIKRSRLQALVHSILTATCVLSLSESQAEAKFTQCGLHAGKTGLRAPDIGLHKHTWPFIPAPSALTLFENGAVFIQQKCFMSMFTLISNDFLLHVLTLPHIHRHTELQIALEAGRSVPCPMAQWRSWLRKGRKCLIFTFCSDALLWVPTHIQYYLWLDLNKTWFPLISVKMIHIQQWLTSCDLTHQLCNL